MYLRSVNYSDIDILYEWANDPVTRANSFSSDLIPYEAHKKWFDKMIHDSSILQFILMNSEGSPVGQIRLNVSGNKAEISYSIAAKYRHQGYGRRLLKLIADKVKVEFPKIKILTAKVKPGNTASQKIFESERYEMQYLYYILDLVSNSAYTGGGEVCTALTINSIPGVMYRQVSAA